MDNHLHETVVDKINFDHGFQMGQDLVCTMYHVSGGNCIPGHMCSEMKHHKSWAKTCGGIPDTFPR